MFKSYFRGSMKKSVVTEFETISYPQSLSLGKNLQVRNIIKINTKCMVLLLKITLSHGVVLRVFSDIQKMSTGYLILKEENITFGKSYMFSY